MAAENKIKNLSDDTFQQAIGNGVTLVDFFAVWCAPCRMLSPIIEQIAEHYQNKVTVAKIDIDSEQKIAAQYQVTSVPTVVLFKDGKEVDRLVGLRDFDALKEFVDASLNA